jgi:hypothetical protein
VRDERYQALFQFFAGRFHEEWADASDDPDVVIAAYLAEHPARDEPSRLADLMDAFAAERPDDAALDRALFAELGCNYDTAADGRTARQWLRHVSAQLRAGARP